TSWASSSRSRPTGRPRFVLGSAALGPLSGSRALPAAHEAAQLGRSVLFGGAGMVVESSDAVRSCGSCHDSECRQSLGSALLHSNRDAHCSIRRFLASMNSIERRRYSTYVP